MNQGDVNPFEPPRAALGAPSAGDPSDARTLSEEAARELTASAPWARWTARLAAAGVAVTILNSLVALSQAPGPKEMGKAIGGLLFGIPIAVIMVVAFRRYAGGAERLAAGDPRAVEAVMDAQRSLFKTVGVIVLLLMGLVFAGVLFAFCGAMTARR
jgi:hypothetical protein